MLTPKISGDPEKKRNVSGNGSSEMKRERWCAYNEKAKNNLYINTVFMGRTFEISYRNFGALLSSNMCWKNATFFHYKKPTFQFRYHELDLGWLVSWMRRCG